MSLWRGFDIRGAKPLLAMVLVAGSLVCLGGGWPIDKLVGDQTLDIEYIRVYRPIPPRLP